MMAKLAYSRLILLSVLCFLLAGWVYAVEKVETDGGNSKIFLSFENNWLEKLGAGFIGEEIQLHVFENGNWSQPETRNIKHIEIRDVAGEKIEGIEFNIKQNPWWMVSIKTNNLVPGVYEIKAVLNDGRESEVSEIKLIDRKIKERLKKINQQLTERVDKLCKACKERNEYEENFALLCKVSENCGISLLPKEERKWLKNIMKRRKGIRYVMWPGTTKTVEEAVAKFLYFEARYIISECGVTIAIEFGKLADKRAIPYLKKIKSSGSAFTEIKIEVIKKLEAIRKGN